jgi:diguanylate cyclase (GGDEF)-like protein
LFDLKSDALLSRLVETSAGLTPVGVTRWTAQLADPNFERAFRLSRFPEDRRRVLLLLALGFAGNVLNLFLELYTFIGGRSGIEPLVFAVAVNVLPVIGLPLVLRTRTPAMLEWFVVGAVTIGALSRLAILGLHPHYNSMWPALMLSVVFVIYLFLPIRLTAALALAVGFSLVAPLFWAWTQAGQLPVEEFARGVIALAVSNGLGFIAANGLQRSQRMQFGQSLMLRELLSTDSMTGIANRRRFDEELAREWRRCSREGVPLSLLMIDIDHFKDYNDHYGHPQGDACLRQVAQLLANEVGRSGDLVARYGGEEFVCLLPGADSDGALTVANKLVAALRDADIAHARSPGRPRLTMSIGVATTKEFQDEPANLLGCADQLLYVAKAAGRDQIAAKRLATVKSAAVNAA